jgi:hypothetical protein
MIFHYSVLYRITAGTAVLNLGIKGVYDRMVHEEALFIHFLKYEASCIADIKYRIGIFLYMGVKCFSEIFAEYTQKNEMLGIKQYSYQKLRD